MRNESHKTLIAIISGHIEAWRKQESWSRETVVQQIVEAHEAINGPANTNIVFEPLTRDTFERAKVNADKVFRWLDDVSKDRNLMPANFLPSILLAMPEDMRHACLNEFLRPLGMGVQGLETVDTGDVNFPYFLRDVHKETSEAVQSIADVMLHPDRASIMESDREAAEAIESLTKYRRAINGIVNATRAVGGAVLKVAAVGRGK